MENNFTNLDKLDDIIKHFDKDKPLESLLDFFQHLPEQTDYNFELYLTKLVNELSGHGEQDLIFEEALNELTKDNNQDKNIRFASFYALNILYRHKLDIDKLKNLFIEISKNENHRKILEKQPLFIHLKSLYLRTIADFEKSDTYFKEALNCAEKAAKELPDHPGVLHSWAEMIVNQLEQEMIKNNNLLIDSSDERIKNAAKAIEDAIDGYSEYSKFYITKGRLLALTGKFNEADREIKKAITMEDSSKPNYSLKIVQYREILTVVNMMARMAKYEKKYDELENKLKQQQVQIIEFLGLFTAIISFTVASIQFSTNMFFSDGAKLLMVFTGCILFIYGCLGISIRGFTWKRTAVIFAIALLLFVISYIFALGLRG